MWTWGRANNGQLGDGTVIARSSPVQIGALTTWSLVDIPVYSVGLAIALKTDGTIWTWGSNNNGTIGDNTTISRSSPVQIGTDDDWTKISAGGNMGAIYSVPF